MGKSPALDMRPEHQALVRHILHRHVPHHEVWVFGSRAKGATKPYSDLDLVVVADTPLPMAVKAALADDFSQSDLPWKVDVVDWATCDAPFRQIIQRHKVVIQSHTNT